MNESTREQNRDLSLLGGLVDTETNSQRVSAFPPDPKTLGMYSVGLATGDLTATLAANSTLYSLRWTSAAARCAIESIYVWLVVTGAITTSVVFGLDLYIARSFTASDSGGTAVTLTGNNQKRRTNMGTSLVADMRRASTAGLTVGTRTLDAQPVAHILSSTGTFAGTVAFTGTALYVTAVPQQYPIVLDANEGIIIRNSTAGPADGTVRLVTSVSWAETDIY